MIQDDSLTLVKNEVIYKDIEVHHLARGQFQPRQRFDQQGLQELADSIKQFGIIQPITVRPLSSGHYEIVAGECRWRAAQLVGLSRVPCAVRELDDRTTLQVALIENRARRNLNCIEEAEAISRLIEEFNYTHEVAAQALSMSRPDVTNLLRLLKLDPKVKMLIMDGDLTETHGRLLAGLPIEKQLALAREAVLKSWSHRVLEKEIKNRHKNLDPLFLKKRGADLQHLERNISDYFGAEVKLDLGLKNDGWLKIHFTSNDELEGILEKAGYSDEQF